MQLKHSTLPGSYPLSVQSTAFNVDYYGARIRSCYEGWVTYLYNDSDGDYHPGDVWGCVGWHWSGHRKDPAPRATPTGSITTSTPNPGGTGPTKTAKQSTTTAAQHQRPADGFTVRCRRLVRLLRVTFWRSFLP
jgi:hypothetical protein